MSASITGALGENTDNRIVQGVCGEEGAPPVAVGMADFSDEVLLCILRYVPVSDLLVNVAGVCRKLRALCRDNTLLSHACLSEDYTANDASVRRVLTQLSDQVRSLSLAGCYWLSGSTLDRLRRCRLLRRLDATSCRLTSARLSRLLAALPLLRALAFDVAPGFDAERLSGEAAAALGRLEELGQTLLTPSYGVVARCPLLRRLDLRMEIPDVTREGAAVCCRLMVAQSSVPHYQELRRFTARLAPGEVNQTLLLLYLAVFRVRVPDRLRVFLVSVPGPNPAPCPAAAASLAESLGRRGDLEALQLPRSWLDAASLAGCLRGNAPAHLDFSRCPAAVRAQVVQSLSREEGGGVRDAARLRSLNLSGSAGHAPYPEGEGGELEPVAGTMARLAAACPALERLSLSHTHYHRHPVAAGDHLCAGLASLPRLRSLALPACALSDGPAPSSSLAPPPSSSSSSSSSSPLLGLRKPPRIGVRSLGASTSTAAALLAGCAASLEELEVTAVGFVSALPRLERGGGRRGDGGGGCAWGRGVGDAQLAALAAALPRLRRLTLAGLPGVRGGEGLVAVAEGCRDLRALSLANLGATNNVSYGAALLGALRQCAQLRELRLEQPYLSAGPVFFEALSRCSLLQRLCVVSRHGTLAPVAVATFVGRCRHLVVCHMFTGGTLAECRALQKTLLDRFSAERPALSVVIHPLLHEDLPLVIRDVPLPLLDQVTLFQSRVAQAPPTSSWQRDDGTSP